MASSKFRYLLDALLKKRRWDLDAARADEFNARRVVTMRTEEARVIGRTMFGLEHELRDMIVPGQEIDLHYRECVSSYLAETRKNFKAKVDELTKAEKLHQDTQRGVRAANQGVRVIENHREGQLREHLRDAGRTEGKMQDDLWLARKSVKD